MERAYYEFSAKAQNDDACFWGGCFPPTYGAAEATFPAHVPDFVMPPDVVETNTLGKLEFIDGVPKPDTVQRVFDNLDLMRGTTAFLDGIPLSSIFVLNRSLRDIGIEPNEIAVSRSFVGAEPSFLPPQTTSIYIISQLDLSDGPVVLDVPKGLLGRINNAGFRYVAEIGPAGPDKGEGGKYLFLPPDYTGDVPEGYFVFPSATFENRAELWTPVKDGDTETPIAEVKERLNIYPLALAKNPPPEIFHDLSDAELNTVHANDFSFFEELNAVIQKEPSDAFSAELSGTFASIGIKKGHPFEPNERMKAILIDAAAIGNVTARVLKFCRRRENENTDKERNCTPTLED